MPPALSTTNVLEGPVYMYFGASIYAPTPDVMPADTVAFGGPPGGTWRSAGYTSQDGIQEHFQTDVGEVFSAQVRNAILRPVTSYIDTLTGTLLEVTLANLRDILGRGTITHVAPTASVAGHDELKLTDASERYIAVLIEGVAPPSGGGQPRRIFYPAVVATGTVEPMQRQGADGANAGVAFEFTRVGGDESAPVFHDILAPTGP